MAETEDFYRRRIEEELAAARQSADPSISLIHREMAERYRELANRSSETQGADHLSQASMPDTQPVFG